MTSRKLSVEALAFFEDATEGVIRERSDDDFNQQSYEEKQEYAWMILPLLFDFVEEHQDQPDRRRTRAYSGVAPRLSGEALG